MGKLENYRRKRNFGSTPEPRGQLSNSSERRFVVQEHAASHLHYDLRLEHAGVLLSWAVPKGPSLDPHVRRLAIQTEDHPVEYADFEGTIPAGEYGGGRVLVWDRGIWQPEGDVDRDLARGRLKFELFGQKLRGCWNLIRIKAQGDWLLIKSRDTFARSGTEADIVDTQPLSVASGRAIDEIDDRDPPDTDPAADMAVNSPPLPVLGPQLATAIPRPPTGPDWLHEIKLDGYRILAFITADEVRLRTRGGEDWTAKLPELAAVLANPALAGSVLDGELCEIGPDGLGNLDGLQRALAEGRTARLVYSVFDLPIALGVDLRNTALIERKQALERLLTSLANPHVRYWGHVRGSGLEVFERACSMGAEGVVSKRADAVYESRRTRTWRKSKCPRRLSAVVGGFTHARGSRRELGALLLGTRDAEGRLHYRGKVGSGFSAAVLAQLRDELEPLRQPLPPFVDPPRGLEAADVEWVAPKLTIAVEYAELSERGRLRQARYVGRTEPAINVRLTHPDKLLFPNAANGGLRKRDVADYFMRVAAWMLPHVRDRPLALVRCPDGVDDECFLQKHATSGFPAAVGHVKITSSAEGDRDYPIVSDALGLVALAQMDVLEIHSWSSRTGDVERPDRLVFDLDPDLELGFDRVITAALELRDRLGDLGLRSFVTTTGGKGLHVIVPIEPTHPYEATKRFCRLLAERMVGDSPDRYVSAAARTKRPGKIFIDYLRNGRGALSIAPYSLRAKPGAPVATPLAWDELHSSLRPADFDARAVPARLAALERDPWAEYFELRQAIPTSLFFQSSSG